ncbi:TPA: GNAT family N-acetyltransferase [archaeon]|uniref:GNAT family N-acetyltransferase n=1 Tax=Candidatus Naiadarchaeum limnaeum TaxID=2756139 RepID=A0A832V040_9ARCH|nr:GNAT family N-acetyltransferase [Candidatus Naiadarchaeum limnaeum]
MDLFKSPKLKGKTRGMLDAELDEVAGSSSLYFICDKCFKNFKDNKLRDRHQKICNTSFQNFIYNDKENQIKIALATNGSEDKERQAAENIAYAVMFDQDYSEPTYRMDIPLFEPHLEHHMFLLLYKEKLVGYACYVRIRVKGEKERKLNLRLIWIAKKYRGRGLGRILYESSLNHFPESDRKEIYYGGPDIKNLDMFVRKFVKEKEVKLLTYGKFDAEYVPKPDD